MAKQSIRPQPGPQTAFLRCKADIAIYGGAAFGGKSYGLLMDAGALAARNPNYDAVLFRRNGKQAFSPGGLWSTSEEIYPLVGALGTRHNKRWRFPNGSTVSMDHLEHEKNKFDWQGSQIGYIGFDELTHFTESQFWYLTTRNRSRAGGPVYVRGTCNPDPDSFVAKLVAWYLDDDGYPMPERSGVLRWFVRDNDEIVWADDPTDLTERFGEDPDKQPKSFTFIPSRIEDNAVGLTRNPGYMSMLMAQGTVDRERLRFGNWKIRPHAGSYFQRGWFTFVNEWPRGHRTIRYWDRASTPPGGSNQDPDWTVGTKMTRDPQGVFWIVDVVRGRWRPADVLAQVRACANIDGVETEIIIEQDPASAGEAEADMFIRELAGWPVIARLKTKAKEVMAKPASTQAQAGNIRILRAPWNDALMTELEAFPSKDVHDDQVDTISGGVAELVRGPQELKTGGYAIEQRGSQFALSRSVFVPRGST